MEEHPIHNQPRDYRRRMRWAVLAALIVHALLLMLPMGFGKNGTLFVPPSPDQQPVVVSLQPRDKPARLITPGAPADSPVDPATDLIAERASKAQDMAPGDNGGNTPDAGAVGQIDDLGPASPPEPKPLVAPEPTPPQPDNANAPEPKPDSDAPSRPTATEPSQFRPVGEPVEKIEEPVPAVAEPPDGPRDAAIQLAKADTPQVPQHAMGKTQTRATGGVGSQGFLSFEAKQSEFAPYLRDVRDRVEKRWKALMHMRYSGTSTAQAVIDCVIAPDGKLDRVAIVELGDSATFAGLCKQAIEQAGPFNPFPFQVPDVYQSKNIEIRWTFNFL